MLSPKVGGIVREVLVEDNQAVKAGQLLARIDERDYEAAAASARAEVAGAEAQLDYARATLQRQQSVIEQATTLVDANQAEDKLAQQELARSQYLAGQGAGSVQNAQQAQSRFDVSRARLAQNRAVRVGALVAPGASLMAVVPLKRSFVVANLQETQLTRVRQGQRASIAIDAYPGVLLHGTVHSIAPATGRDVCRHRAGKTPPATSPRWCNASPSRLNSMPTRSSRTACAWACRPKCASIRPCVVKN